MKRCPVCEQTYTDPNINFCLNDGELLSHLPGDQQSLPANEPPTLFADDAPPTLFMNRARETRETNWQPTAAPLTQWQQQRPVGGRLPDQFAGLLRPKDHTLPTISMILAISSIIMVCCAGGVWLGLPAAILGFLGMRNADRDPARYGGRGMAIGGMIIGVITFFASMIVMIAGSF
jgi:hypothetical protein